MSSLVSILVLVGLALGVTHFIAFAAGHKRGYEDGEETSLGMLTRAKADGMAEGVKAALMYRDADVGGKEEIAEAVAEVMDSYLTDVRVESTDDGSLNVYTDE